MEQTVAPGTGLTAQQKQLLDLAIQEPYFLQTFYLSGGTALASWYLHHRESYDLDFFSLTIFDYDKVIRWIKENQEKIGYRYLHLEEDFGFLSATFRYPNDAFLKLDFHHYTNTKLRPGFKWNGLEIDSLFDIAANKLDTIATRPRDRDFVDFYFILKKWPLSLEQIILEIPRKFPDIIDPTQLSKNFLKVKEYSDIPKMLVSFDQKKMEKFYLDLAKSLKKKIFK